MFLLRYVLAMIVLVAISAPVQAKPFFTFQDLDGVKNSLDFDLVIPDISPDNRTVAVSQGHALQVIETGQRRVHQELGDGILPHWSPKGGMLAFYSVRSGTMQLWIWNVANGEMRQVTHFKAGVDPDLLTRIVGWAIDAFDYEWSPDGTRMVFASRVGFPTEGGKGAPLILDRTTPSALTLSGIFSHPSGATGGVPESPDGMLWQYRSMKPEEMLLSRLFVVDVRTGVTTMLPGVTGNVFHPRWSPDSKYIAYTAIDPSQYIPNTPHSEIRVRDMTNGNDFVVASGAGFKYRPRWSNDGKTIAYVVGSPISDLETVALDGQGRKRYTLGKRLLEYDWARNGDGLLLSYVDGAVQWLGRLRVKEETIQPVWAGVLRWSQANDGTLLLGEPLKSSVSLLSPAAKGTVKLASTGAEISHKDFQLGRLQTIDYQSAHAAHGVKLQGHLLYAPDYRPGKRYPLIVDAYPLSSGHDWTHPMGGNQAWGTAGYLVFKPYLRAPHAWPNCSGDAAFCAASRGAGAWDSTVEDVMSGVDALIGRGLVDPARMCLYGHSNGGGVVSYLVTRTNRFKCAVIVAPVYSSWIGSPLLSTSTWQSMANWVGVDVLTDPDAYVKLSAVFRARRVETPILLAAGDDDGNFLLGAIEMYNALRFANKDVTLLRYPDQGHLFRGDGLCDLWQREMTFFARYLKPDQHTPAARAAEQVLSTGARR